MGGKRIFIDTNVLVYANNTKSPFCQMARTKLELVFKDYESVWLSRQVFREFSVVVTREMLSQGEVDYKKLKTAIQQFEADFQIAEDSKAVTQRWLQLLADTKTAGKQVHDANLVATMLEHGVDCILTHNVADFQRFARQITVVPLM